MQASLQSPKKILIVEDDMLLSLVEERLVEKLGHKVVGKATSGEEAIQKYNELSPDLILMDIILKGEMDGIQAMETIREHSDVPVIYLSGNSDQYNYERAKETDFTDYLVKPVSSHHLTEPLNRAFSNDSKSSTPKRMKSRSGSGNFINRSA